MRSRKLVGRSLVRASPTNAHRNRENAAKQDKGTMTLNNGAELARNTYESAERVIEAVTALAICLSVVLLLCIWFSLAQVVG